jgi:D-lactate dehydrogenase (cytochrome)
MISIRRVVYRSARLVCLPVRRQLSVAPCKTGGDWGRGSWAPAFMSSALLLLIIPSIIALSAAENDSSSEQRLLSELSSILSSDQMELDFEERKLRSKVWNSYHKTDNVPIAVLYPTSTDEVSKILGLCYTYDVPVVAFGGGTSLEGQTLTSRGGISLDFSRMKQVLSLHEQDLDVTVQAGLGYIELNEILRSKGLWFPLDPGPGASIGGMAACRCSGSTALRYGSMRENVLNLTAVLADGTIIKTGSRARKSSAGYDITRLLIGSEGTLAIITEATLKIYGIPRYSYAMRISFPRGIHDAACTARDSLNCGVTVGRCELLDDEMVKIINSANINHPLGKWPEITTLLYEVTGLSEASVKEQAMIIEKIAKKNGASKIETYCNDQDTKQIWKLRKEVLWSAMSSFPDYEPMITDVCVPLSELPGLVTSSKQYISTISLPCPIVAHAGDGNFHVLIFFKPTDPLQVKQAKDFANWMALQAIKLGGTCTGEHGIGLGKKELLAIEMGNHTMNVMRKIKNSLDEKNLLNPDKIFDNHHHENRK